MSTVYSIDGRAGACDLALHSERHQDYVVGRDPTRVRRAGWCPGRGHPKADAVERPDSVYGVERVMDTLRYAMTMKTRAAHMRIHSCWTPAHSVRRSFVPSIPPGRSEAAAVAKGASWLARRVPSSEWSGATASAARSRRSIGSTCAGTGSTWSTTRGTVGILRRCGSLGSGGVTCVASLRSVGIRSSRVSTLGACLGEATILVLPVTECTVKAVRSLGWLGSSVRSMVGGLG